MAENQLVLQNNKEKLAVRLQNFEAANSVAKQQAILAQKHEKLRKTEDCFAREFCKLSQNFYGLTNNQLCILSEEEIKELANFVGRKAWPWAIIQVLFTFGVPVAGWLLGFWSFQDKVFHSWLYLFHRRRLRKAYGENWFPRKEIQKHYLSR